MGEKVTNDPHTGKRNHVLAHNSDTADPVTQLSSQQIQSSPLSSSETATTFSEKKDLELGETAKEGHRNLPNDTHGINVKKSKRKWEWNPLRWQAIPPVPKERPMSKEATAEFFSKLTFMWMGDFMKVGYLRTLEPTDIPIVPPYREAKGLTERLTKAFNTRVQKGEKHPLLWALNEVFFREFWLAGLCRLAGDLLLAFAPLLLRYLVAFANEAYLASRGVPGYKHPPVGRGIGMAIGLGVMQVLASFCVSHFVYRGMMVGGQARAALIGSIFAKSMKISGRAKTGKQISDGKNDSEKKGSKKARKVGEGAGWTNGRVVNLMSTDTYRIDQASAWFHMMLSSPILVIVTLILLLVNIGYSALAGFGLLIVGTPFLGWVVKILAERRKKMNRITDKRVGLMQEILMGVRFVKYYGWEQSFLTALKRLRDEEISAVQFLLGVRSGINAIGMSLPVFASMLAFITYSLTNHRLDAARIFSSLALFNILRLPLNLLPVVVAQNIDAWVSLQRIEEYLLAEEINEDIIWDREGEKAVEITEGNFTWEKNISDGVSGEEPILKEDIKRKRKEEKEKKRRSKMEAKSESNTPTGALSNRASLSDTNAIVEEEREPFALKNVNFSVGRKELVAIVGSVGSGKSSLLAALAGEMRKVSGTVKQGAGLAYCPQYAWIQNATVRDNIIFGKEFDERWYNQVIEACALKHDLDILPHGDMTEIGERGITLSGGQKQRVNIARAIYFNADIVLMDDPLSAVDAHVGKHLFDNAICGLLKDKCRILATHQLHVIHKCDRVVWMEDGRIEAIGTYEELMKRNPGFVEMMGEIAAEEKPEEKKKISLDLTAGEDEDDIDEDQDMEKVFQKQKSLKIPPKALMQAEERAVDSVPWSVYHAYIKASGSILVAPFIILLLLCSQGSNIITTLWLSYWVSDKFKLSNGEYIGIFSALGVAQSLFMFLFAYSLTIAGTRSSKKLMQKAVERTLRAPMSFFDTTPVGRIVNRFSKDVDVMDNNLTDAMRMYFFTLGIISSVLILIIVFYPYFAVALVPLITCLLLATAYYRASAREVKRHESTLRSFVYAKFGEGLTGTACIRAYGLQQHFISELQKAINDMDGAYFITFSNQRWLSLRLDFVGNLLVFTVAILVVTSRFNVNPAISGVVLSYILMIVQMIQWMIRQMAEVENSMNATERIHYYGTELPQEAPLHTNVQVPPEWPDKGEISMQNIKMRYRDGLPLVLKGFSLDIKGGERVGVVGRTGAGKSSLMAALFRLIELEEGKILIDGIDISKIGLADLRSKLSIIPQDPTLFRGTVRSNLDPFGKYSDVELWTALRQAYLVNDDHNGSPSTGSSAEHVPQQNRITLDTAIEEEGLNFSLGQRQLMALARALVRGSRIIVCDEATSSVDIETDRKIQRTMKTGFRGRTLLCIAHRLRTIIHYDRVCVMDNGMIVEMDTPLRLFDNQGGIFRGMCDRSKIRREDILRGDEEDEE